MPLMEQTSEFDAFLRARLSAPATLIGRNVILEGCAVSYRRVISNIVLQTSLTINTNKPDHTIYNTSQYDKVKLNGTADYKT